MTSRVASEYSSGKADIEGSRLAKAEGNISLDGPVSKNIDWLHSVEFIRSYGEAWICVENGSVIVVRLLHVVLNIEPG